MRWLKRWLTRTLIDRQALRTMVRDEVELYMDRNPMATRQQVESALLDAVSNTLLSC